MTKKDYTALAAALKATKPVYTGDKFHMDYAYHGIAYQQWVDDVTAITEVCAVGNTSFSRGKFIAACGVPNILDK